MKMYPLLQATMIIEDPSVPLKQNGLGDFSSCMDHPGGELVSLQRGRTVTRIELDNRAFYLKRNRLDWRELVKTILHLQWPLRNALNEWENIFSIKNIGIPTVNPVAMGERTFLGLEIGSFLISEELYGAESLERVIEKTLTGPNSGSRRNWKWSIVRKAGRLARLLHKSGMCHQDFYLGHIFKDEGDILYLIDLQRVLRRKKTSRRYIVKDLGQLNFSADCAGNLSRTDRMRFFLEYLDVKSLGSMEKKLARSVTSKSDRIARHTLKLLSRRRRRGEIQ
jgi:heptose I phosphotransferase